MTDIARAQKVIGEYYTKIFYHCPDKNVVVRRFIQKCIQLVDIYSQLPHFVSFPTKIPLLRGLYPHAKSVLIVLFEDSQIFLPNVSVFPLYPFPVRLKHKNICCKEGIDLLLLYLEITNIKIVGFYRVNHYKRIVQTIKGKFPKMYCYPPNLFKYFCRINKGNYGSLSQLPKNNPRPAKKLQVVGNPKQPDS